MVRRPEVLDAPLDRTLGVRSDAEQLEGDAFVQKHDDLVAVVVSCDIAHKK